MVTRTQILLAICLATAAAGQENSPPGSLNKPERLEWFRDQGFGLFIHWSANSQTGVVISHSLVGADDAYTNRFFNELPKTFNPHIWLTKTKNEDTLYAIVKQPPWVRGQWRDFVLKSVEGSPETQVSACSARTGASLNTGPK